MPPDPLLFSWAGCQNEAVLTFVFSFVCKAAIKCDIFVYVLQVIYTFCCMRGSEYPLTLESLVFVFFDYPGTVFMHNDS